VFKKIKILLIVLLLVVITSFTVHALALDDFESVRNTDTEGNFSYIEDQFLSSSRFTQKNDVSSERLNDYLTNYQINYQQERLDELGFTDKIENDKFALYFENDSYSIVLINKQTGFVWSSRAEFQQYSDGNNTARNLMNSGVWVDYVKTNVTTYRTTTASLYTATKATYYAEGEVLDTIRPYKIKPNSYDKKVVEVISNVNDTTDVISSTISFKELKISFKIELSLTENGIDVFIPNDSIKEEDQNTRLTNIYVFPFLGSTREDKTPGYFVIPDGVGALVRLDSEYNNEYNGTFYGGDLGYNNNYREMLTLPIYGIVHLENENAMYANITSGSEHTVLQGKFWGANSKYFRLNSKFILRQVYKTIIDRAGNGYDSVLNEINSSDFGISYTFLEKEKASYSGIASDYQNVLFNDGYLTSREVNHDENIPLLTNYLLSDREKSFLGTKKVTMSTTSEILEMYGNFSNNNITNQIVNLMGYSKDGNMNRAPYRISLIESEKNFKQLISTISNDNNTIYLENSYTYSSDLNGRISYNRDVAKNISKIRQVYERYDLNDNKYEIYQLNPIRSLSYAKSDASKIAKLGFSGVTLGSDAYLLYSYYDDGNYFDRLDSLNTYQEMYGLFDKVQMRSPNLYALKYASAYLDMPITNSQYDYFTDLIPLLPQVLKGYVSYFTPNLNFNALGHQRILSMVDFAINPSFILTYSPTYKMRYTQSNLFYSTTYSEYQDEVIETYNYVNVALKTVIDAKITNREVIETGLVLVTYSNGVKIYINYNNKQMVHGSTVISANDYKVVKS